MWPTVVLALAALNSAQTLREVQPVASNPSAISNIELLIPITISRKEEPTVNTVESNEAQDVDHDEPFSSIPASAFTLDTDQVSGYPRASLSKMNYPPPKLSPGHSLYLSSIWQRPQEARQKKQEGYKRNEIKQNGCLSLANQHNSEARELLLYLCSELISVLSSRCDCCAKEEQIKKPKARLEPAMPWFEPIDNRGIYQYALDDDDADNKMGPQISV